MHTGEAMSTFPGWSSAQGLAQQQELRERDPARARQAAIDMVWLMQQKLDVTIDATAWRLFLKVYWSRVSALAHTIHENEE